MNSSTKKTRVALVESIVLLNKKRRNIECHYKTSRSHYLQSLFDFLKEEMIIRKIVNDSFNIHLIHKIADTNQELKTIPNTVLEKETLTYEYGCSVAMGMILGSILKDSIFENVHIDSYPQVSELEELRDIKSYQIYVTRFISFLDNYAKTNNIRGRKAS